MRALSSLEDEGVDQRHRVGSELEPLDRGSPEEHEVREKGERSECENSRNVRVEGGEGRIHVVERERSVKSAPLAPARDAALDELMHDGDPLLLIAP